MTSLSPLDPGDLTEREVFPGVLRQSVMLPMGGGVELATDVWRPVGEEPVPVLVQRLPYGRRVASASVLPGPVELVERGFAVVLQDLRGTGDSGGQFVPFTDVSDGVTTVEWAADLPFTTGDVATYGFSHQGYNQVQVAAARPRGLRGIAPMMCAAAPDEFLHVNGVRRWDFLPKWAAQLSRLAGDTRAVPDLKGEPSRVLGEDPPGWYLDWLTHTEQDDYWAPLTADLDRIEVPALVVLGWADLFAASTWRLAEQLQHRAAVRVVAGPWDHIPWSARVGDLDLGPEAGPAVAHRAFDDFLHEVFGTSRQPVGGRDNEQPEPHHHYFELGEGWRSATTWPPAVTHRILRASADTSARSRFGDGVLRSDRGPETGRWDHYVADPDSPVPGTQTPFPRTELVHERRDVLVWTAEPELQPVHLVGRPGVVATVTSDAPTVDVIAAVHVIGVDGAVRQVSQGIRRLDTSAGPASLELPLSPVAWRIAPGEQLRLDISSSRWPQYELNPQTTSGRDRPMAATVAVSGVALTLPLTAKDPA